jgi:hypothetical protein
MPLTYASTALLRRSCCAGGCRQGLPGLPWCAGVPVRRACGTGTVPLAVELIEGHGAGGEREPGRDARMPPGSRTGLRDGRAADRVPGDPVRSGPGGGRHPPVAAFSSVRPGGATCPVAADDIRHAGAAVDGYAAWYAPRRPRRPCQSTGRGRHGRGRAAPRRALQPEPPQWRVLEACRDRHGRAGAVAESICSPR